MIPIAIVEVVLAPNSCTGRSGAAFFTAPYKIKEVEMILQAGWKVPQRFHWPRKSLIVIRKFRRLSVLRVTLRYLQWFKKTFRKNCHELSLHKEG